MRLFTVVAVMFASASIAAAQDQQLGARTKAMGGSYTAFEDDPVSIWLNPAGIATQPDQLAVIYQTYTAYPVESTRGAGDSIETSVEADTILVDPPALPSYLGAVFQLGDQDAPMSIGVCYARPYHLNYAMNRIVDPNQTEFEPRDNVEQAFYRFRFAFARDFKLLDGETPGFFSHIAVGGGLDVGFERWDFRSADQQDRSDSSTSFGFGFGVLVGVYDNLESFKVAFGLAYQSPIEFDFNIDPDVLPAFDMPQQVNMGTTFYLLQDTPLRMTIDLQYVWWEDTAEAPVFSNQPSFEDALNFSVGFEYRLQISEKLTLYPRAGYRRFDAPWEDENNLPSTGAFKLVLDTEGEAFNIFTFGAGLAWQSSEGKGRSVDFGVDIGGDAFNFAIGLNYEL